MLLLLPLFTLIIVFLDLLAFQQRLTHRLGLRFAFILALLISGAYIALTNELLSLLDALTKVSVIIVWLLALAVSLWIGISRGWLRLGFGVIVQRLRTLKGIEIFLLAFLGIILSGLFLVAVIAVPNNTDSLAYHMPRVMHWAQNHSLEHYPTSYEPQLFNPIWAEEAILHSFLLLGSDRAANLVQWTALFSALVGVSLLASLLGAGRKGQIASAVFALSVPMGLVQASSTQNDLVTAMWLVFLACFVVLAHLRKPGWYEIIGLSLAVGLGLLTKGTFYVYAIPLGILFLIILFKQHPIQKVLTYSSVVIIIVVILNAGFWVRNIITFGGPLGSKEWIADKTAASYGVMPFLSDLARNTLMNFVTPFAGINDRILSWLQQTFGNYDPEMLEFKMLWGWNHDDMAGNPLQMILIGLSGAAVLFLYRRLKLPKILLFYAISVTAMFLLLALLLTYDQYGIRYQLPFLIAWAPVFGVLLSAVGLELQEIKGSQRLLRATPAFISVLLLLSCLPWVLFNRARPLIAMRDNQERLTIGCDWLGCTSVGSILVEKPTAVLFANWTDLREPYRSLSSVLIESGCKNIGLRIDSHDLEYPFWRLLSAPQSGIRIESLAGIPAVQRYADQNFKPCAIVCTTCGDNPSTNGLPLTDTFGPVRLYQGTGFIPED